MSAIEPTCDQAAPFLMWVSNVFRLGARWTWVYGNVERGILKRAMPIDVVGLLPTSATIAAEVWQNHRMNVEVVCGKLGGVLLPLAENCFQVGQVIAARASIQAVLQFRGNMQVVSEAERSENHAFIPGAEVQFFFRNVHVPGAYAFLDGVDPTVSTNRVILICTLTRPIAMEEGQEFTIYNGGKVVGTGKVIELITKI